MKLLIDIPEHIYEHAKEESEDSRDEFEAMRAIANGSQQESRSEIPNTCGDAISRDAAVNAIYDLCGENVSLKENPWRDNPHMDVVVDALENLPSVTPQPRTERWIPVSERLPEENMLCLVSVGKLYLTQTAIYSDLMGTIDQRIFYQGDYGHETFVDITQYVNAWMPFPEPYKAESEDKE